MKINIFKKYEKLLNDLYSNDQNYMMTIKDDRINNKYIKKYGNIEKKNIKSSLEWIFRTLYFYEFTINKYNNLKVNIPFYDEYSKNGYLILENFINKKDFKEILKEVNKLTSNIILTPSEKPYKLYISDLDDKSINTKKFFKNKKLIYYLKYCSFLFEDKIPMKKNFIEILCHADLKNDIQKTWHIDTFHNTCKWWFYLEDIQDDNKGAFEYIKGSHKNTFNRLKYEKKCIEDIQSKKITDNGSLEGSLRYYNDKTIKSLGYNDNDFIKAKFKKNTLLIVNTHGIHKRGCGKVGTSRLSLGADLRKNIY